MIDAALVFIGLGLAFNLFGCLGLVRLPDVYNRLQAATKCVTLGTCSILFGVALASGFTDTGIKSLLTIVFILLTAPVAAHAIARGCRRGGVPLWSGSVVDTYPADAASGQGLSVSGGLTVDSGLNSGGEKAGVGVAEMETRS